MRSHRQKLGMLGFSPSQWQMKLTSTKNESLFFPLLLGGEALQDACMCIHICICIIFILHLYIHNHTYILHITIIYIYHIYVQRYMLHVYIYISYTIYLYITYQLHILKIIKKYKTSTHQPNPRGASCAYSSPPKLWMRKHLPS